MDWSEDDACVEADGAVTSDEERVDLDLRDLGVGGRESGQCCDRARRGGDVERWTATGSREQGRGDERVDELLRSRLIDRGERDGDVAKQLGVETTGGDHHERPEARVAPRTDEQLESHRHALGRLDRERLRREPRDEVVERLSKLKLVAESEDDAARVRLVQHAERLEGDWEAELLRRRKRLIPAPRGSRRDEPNARPGERRP